MSSFLYQLGRAVVRRRGLVIVAWLVVLALGGTLAVTLTKGTDDTFSIPGSESQDALNHLGHVFPQVSGTSAQLVVVVPDGETVDTAVIRRAVGTAVDRIDDVEQVAVVANPFDDSVDGALSPDGRAALIAIFIDGSLADITPDTKAQVSTIAADLDRQIGGDVAVYAGGDAFADKVPKLSPTEGIGLVIALLVLSVMFRNAIAAAMPLVTAILGVGISVAVIYLATVVTPISSTAPMLAVMLGLAVGIDYALFLLSRHRDQLAERMEVEESIARATATAGSAVTFAGLTVIIALLGLSVAGIPFLTTMGVAAAFGVAVAVCVAETLVPALMAVAGERLRPRVPRRRAQVDDTQQVPSGRRPRIGLARRWVRTATRRPIVTIILIVVALGTSAIPAAQLRLALPDNGSEEQGSPARETYEVVAEHFGPGYNGPLIVTADIIQSTDPIGLVDDIADEIRDLPGVASVPLATPNEKGDTGVIQVIPESGPDDARTDALVERLRDQEGHWQEKYDTATAVTGFTAVGIDVSAKLGASLLPFGTLVVGLSLVLLAMVFRSVWVPIKATVGYLLSVGSAFGATSFVFQQGHLAEVLHVAHTGSVISFLPIILMGVLFGLAMDYEVFLVSRIREHYAHHGNAAEAIEEGFVSASGVVTAAALIMFGVFAAFVPEGSATIKPIALALAVGVFVDAFLVRMTFVPAVLALLGDRAWGLPPTLDRSLPVFDAEGDALVHELRLRDWPSPDSPEVISARGVTLEDDRGSVVVAETALHLLPGEVLVLSGSGALGKSALLATLAGRVTKFRGDLKVLGRVIPNHVRTVRARCALIEARTAPSVPRAVSDALEDGVTLILIDDVDLVLRSHPRDQVRRFLAHRTAPSGSPVSYVLTCQDAARIADILPARGVRIHPMGPPVDHRQNPPIALVRQPAEVQ